MDSMAATRRDNEVIINELENEESKRQREFYYPTPFIYEITS